MSLLWSLFPLLWFYLIKFISRLLGESFVHDPSYLFYMLKMEMYGLFGDMMNK